MEKDFVVALVCDAIYPYSRGGREFRYQALLPRLATQLDVHVYTMQWWDGPKVYTEGGITYHAISSLIPMYTKGRRSTRHAMRFGFACLRLLAHRFDVLDADQIPYFPLFALRLVATIKRKPLVVTWHEVWSRAYWRQYLGWLGSIAWLVESIAMRLPDHIIAASSQTHERLRSIMGEDAAITTVPNGTDLAKIREAPFNLQPTDIISIGRLISHKRVDDLLEVVASLHARGVYATCRIVGDGPDRLSLEQKARTLGIESFVEFRHDVSDQTELYSLIKASTLFVSLSTREGFGMAVLEAIACKTRVLTTSAQDNLAQHLVKRYSRGTVCGPLLEEITDAVYALLSQPESGAKKITTDSWVYEYDWNTMTDRIVRVYTSDPQAPAGGGSSAPVVNS